MQGWKTPTSPVTLSYSSADAPVFVASTSEDLTGSISPGMRLRLSQSTGGTKYFIIVAINGSTITLYGGTDYTLNNETISDPVFSPEKAPYGFPLSPTKWTVELLDTSDFSQNNPTNTTWYNAESLSIPIGSWSVYYYANLETAKSGSGDIDAQVTLSTSNNSESDTVFTASYYLQTGVNADKTFLCPTTKEKNILLTSKTTYYMNVRTKNATVDRIRVRGSESETVIRAVCAYL